MISQLVSGTAFNISAITLEGPAAPPFFMHLKDFNMSSGFMNCAGQGTDEHVEGFETTETQYSAIVYNVVSMLVSVRR